MALRLSWRRAGLLVQGFFLGNVLPMTAAVGQLYQDAPVRLCNAYLLDDQVRLGWMLVALAVAVALAWFAQLVLALMRRDSAAALPPARRRGHQPSTSIARKSLTLVWVGPVITRSSSWRKKP